MNGSAGGQPIDDAEAIFGGQSLVLGAAEETRQGAIEFIGKFRISMHKRKALSATPREV